VNIQARIALSLLVLVSAKLPADDGAASIAVGGIVTMKREPRITMAKEVLQISFKKVIVDYDFRNDSDEDITTEVAFPVPDYENDLDRSGRVPAFDDFQLAIDGKPAHFDVEARAFLKNVEYTELLNSLHVDIASFGHATPKDGYPDIEKLPLAQKYRLVAAGLIDSQDGEMLWSVRKKYYWSQTFPAHKLVHIQHEYTPIAGNENSVAYGMGPTPANYDNHYEAEEIKSFCIDGGLHTMLQDIADGKTKDKQARYSYVDFILTTANTWKTPIEDFTLIVERPHWKSNRGESDLGGYISFCWDGPVKRIDADHFSAHVENLVPARELRIGFFGVKRK
jgi:hypothetical protein